MEDRKTISKVMIYFFVVIASLIVLIPLYVLVINSFKDKYESLAMGVGLPSKFHLDNYLVVIEKGRLYQTFFNSVLYTCVPLIPSVLISSMAAFVLARNRTKLNNFLYYFIILGLTIPHNYVTLFKLLQILHLYDTRLGMYMIYIASGISFNTFIFYGFMSRIPKEMEEAAIIDGCTPLQMYFRIIFPLLKPAIATVSVLNFMYVWNDFINPLYFTGSSSKWPMTLAVYNFFGRFLQEWNLVCADIIMTSIPVVIVYLIGQKYIVSGLTMGAVKG